MNFDNLYNMIQEPRSVGKIYFDKFVEKYMNRFKWNHKNLTQFDKNRIEYLLLKNGVVGVDYKDNKFIIYDGNFGGEPDENGIGKRFIGATLNGQSIDVERDKIVVILNNKLMKGDFSYIFLKAMYMKDCETSEKILIRNTRATKIPVANTDNDKRIIETAVNKTLEGETVAIVSPLSSFDESGGIQTLDITSPELIRTMECLTAYKQSILQEVCAEMGISIAGKDKNAQMNESELKPLGQYSLVTLSDNLECRQTACDSFKELYGIDVTCELNNFFNYEECEDTQDIIEGDTDDTEGDTNDTETTDGGSSTNNQEGEVAENV